MLNTFLKTCALCLIPIFMVAQSDLTIGQWDTHMSFTFAELVAVGNEKIFYATDGAVLIEDKEDGSHKTLDKVSGLSDVGIRNMLYDEKGDRLILTYASSVIDIVNSNGITKVSDIKDKTSIQGDKNIYDLYLSESDRLYLATGFGLVEFDLQTEEFGFTLDISSRVTSIDGEGSSLTFGTDAGAYTIDLASGGTPAFIGDWMHISPSSGLDDQISDVLMTSGKTYVATENEVHRAVSGSSDFELVYEDTVDGRVVLFIKETPDGWMVGSRVLDASPKGVIEVFDEEDGLIQTVTSCFRKLLDAEMNEDYLAVADGWGDLKTLSTRNFNDCETYEVDGPYDKECRSISIGKDGVFFASGGVTDNLGDRFGRFGFYMLDSDKNWANVNEYAYPVMNERSILSLVDVAASKESSKAYFASYYAGLLTYDAETDELKLYNEMNSLLDFPVGDGRVRLSGITLDEEENVWMSNYLAPEPVVVMTKEGEWYEFELPPQADTKVEEIVVDDNGFAWTVISGSTGGVVVIDKGSGFEETLNDRKRFINLNNSEIPSSIVNTVEVDNEGAVWVGTALGAVVFDCGDSVFNQDLCQGNKRKVEVDGILGFLLETEDVLTIAVDGANRKWFGTRNGIFVMSPSGEELVARYEVGSSPLLHNTIRDLAFEKETGVMYLATDGGLQSLRTQTTGAKNTHASKVYAFPNPVRPEYSGPIAIKGLANNADVRITDLDGKLVYKTEALGGQAIWDGMNLEGDEVSGGVYLVFSNNNDFFGDVDAHVTKILVVK